ncbi:MAG TPA: DUF1592 domain-containing protein, partial [Polyangiaceae bacterium]|nr:DUF1592 domain-containing protein [Polyangiaceae bacterium]
AANFVSEDAAGFDNVASGLGMTPGQYESYFNTAESLARELFADPARRGKLVSCTPSGSDGGACLGTFFRDFGTRAFRRPLSSSEQDGLRRAYQRARTLGESELGALEHVTVAMLASASFLYRSELDASAAPGQTRPLDGYELASRLSYFVWSTLPDAELLTLAESGELLQSDVLHDQLARLLEDARASQLIDTFAAQWLGLRELTQHKVLSERYPSFDEALRSAMLEEARAYVREFLERDRPLSEFLSAEQHFVDKRLARHYGITEPAQAGFVRVEQPIGQRRGFTGLAAFLTLSSFAHRTSPTLRAKWILEELLCSPVPPPPPNVALQLEGEDQANAAATIENVRKRLELHRSDPKCAGCHRLMDPIGLGLEGFDGIGRARDRYENGDAIDARGELPDGTRFDGPVQLASVLASDPRFLRCATQKLLTFSLQRSLEDDVELIDATLARFKQTGTLRALIEAVVLSPAFRQQRAGEGGA